MIIDQQQQSTIYLFVWASKGSLHSSLESLQHKTLSSVPQSPAFQPNNLIQHNCCSWVLAKLGVVSCRFAIHKRDLLRLTALSVQGDMHINF